MRGPRGDGHIAAHRYPFVLVPNTSDNIFLTQIERFEHDVPRILHRGRLPPTLAARWLRAYVYTDGGSLFRATLDGTIRKHIREPASAENLGASSSSEV